MGEAPFEISSARLVHPWVKIGMERSREPSIRTFDERSVGIGWKAEEPQRRGLR